MRNINRDENRYNKLRRVILNICEMAGFEIRGPLVLIDKKTGKFDLEKAGLIAYSHGAYHKLGPAIGKFGFSVQKRK